MLPFEFNLKLDFCCGWVSIQSVIPIFSSRKQHGPASGSPTDIAVQEFRQALEEDGATLRNLRVGGEKCDDVFLRRWLSSKRYDVNSAAVALKSHATWRAAFAPNGCIRDSEICGELKAGKVFLQGCTGRGEALLIVLARKHDMNVRDFGQTEKLIVYTLDAASALADIGDGKKICCLFDLSGLRLRNLDVKVLTAIFELLQKHYPERLGMLWFVNAPFIFWAVWRVVSPLIEECSRQKIKFVSCHEARCSSFLQDSVSAHVLPKCYGGRAEMIPIEVASHQLFRQGITHSTQLMSTVVSSHLSSEKESWKAWLKRHKRVKRIVNWITVYSNSVIHNRFNRYLWTKTKRFVWKRKAKIHIVIPPYPIRNKPPLSDILRTDSAPLPLAWWLMLLVIIHFALIFIGQLRTYIIHAAWLQE